MAKGHKYEHRNEMLKRDKRRFYARDRARITRRRVEVIIFSNLFFAFVGTVAALCASTVALEDTYDCWYCLMRRVYVYAENACVFMGVATGATIIFIDIYLIWRYSWHNTDFNPNPGCILAAIVNAVGCLSMAINQGFVPMVYISVHKFLCWPGYLALMTADTTQALCGIGGFVGALVLSIHSVMAYYGTRKQLRRNRRRAVDLWR